MFPTLQPGDGAPSDIALLGAVAIISVMAVTMAGLGAPAAVVQMIVADLIVLIGIRMAHKSGPPDQR